MIYLSRTRAADYLSALGISTSEQGLADKARRGIGPKYSIVNGRALYTAAGLDVWVAEQAARPVVRRSQRQAAGVAA